MRKWYGYTTGNFTRTKSNWIGISPSVEIKQPIFSMSIKCSRFCENEKKEAKEIRGQRKEREHITLK